MEQKAQNMTPLDGAQAAKSKWIGRWKLIALLTVCMSPIFLSYLTYYVIKPQKRSNYGELLDPRLYPIPDLQSTSLDGKAQGLQTLRGKWLLVQIDSGACNDACQKKLYAMRQLRTMQGKERERIERVWLIPDSEPLETIVMREYDGTHMLRVNAQVLNKWLPVEAGANLADHLYIIDPLGNLILRYSKNPDPYKIKNDMTRLLKASSIG